MAAKKYTPKDINKNGKLDQWEIKKYEVINKGKPQMGMGEQAALKPKFLKGMFTKDDGSMSTFGNVSNVAGPLSGLVGIGKSIVDLVRGGNPAMMDKPLDYVSDAQRKAVHASKEDGGKGKPKLLKSKLSKTDKGYSKNVSSRSTGSKTAQVAAQTTGQVIGGVKKAAKTFASKYMKRGGHKALTKGKAVYNFISGTGKGGFAKATGKLATAGAQLGGAAAGTAAQIGGKIAANRIQQGVAKKRVKKFGQAGSAIIPNKKITGGSKVGDAIREGVRSYRGEKTFTHSTAKASRASARAVRKQAKGKIYKADNIKPRMLKNKRKNYS